MDKNTKKEDFLLEIGTEELPSSSIREGIRALEDLSCQVLKENRLGFEDIVTYGTPRRLALIIQGLDVVQGSTKKVLTGPPYRIAFDKEGRPTKAAIGFANSNGVNVKHLEKIETEKGDYLGLTVLIEGKNTKDILPSMIEKIIRSIPFSMQMTWSDLSFRFARPIRWLVTLYGTGSIDLSIENISSGLYSKGHRTLGNDKIKFSDPLEYASLMEKEGKVIVDPSRRKSMILDSIMKVEKSRKDFEVLVDPGLLEEVVNLIEIPNVLVGSFPKAYLDIPRQILVKAIQHHQRYFAVTDKDGSVKNEFVLVQNGIEDPDGEVIKGNERVLNARLSDASYFYEEDDKKDFKDWFEKLSGLVFYSGLGNMQDKSKRIMALGSELIERLGANGVVFPDKLPDIYKRAAYICKCDLVTNMVVEFPELQGIVGKEYAKNKGEHQEASEAVFEHYLPRFADDNLPSTDTGSLLSLADKIDTITGMFLVDNIPTGSQDPFALRRKASGIVLIALDKGYDFELRNITRYSIDQILVYTDDLKADRERLIDNVVSFILARQRFNVEKKLGRLDVFDAVASTYCSSVFKLQKRYEQLYDFIEKENAELLVLPMTRCKNIIKGREITEVHEGLFKEKTEKELYKAITEKRQVIKELDGSYGYGDILSELRDFGPIVDKFFDDILVMDKDEKIRQNRINLVSQAADLYMMFADFSILIT